jgi:hypothetical protein
MAERSQAREDSGEQTNGSDAGGRKAVVRAAALAAASGATAYAAKKAFSDRGDSEGAGDERSSRRSKGGGSMLKSAVSSGWESAQDSLMPLVADVAGRAGEYIGRSAPDLVRETVVPRFIAGFERARKSSD